MKPENSPLLACPRCGTASSQTSSAGGICLRCVGTRVLALESADFTGVGPSFAAETPPAASPRAAGINSPERIGAYEIIEELGHGGMGRVFAARQTGLGRIVALKVIAESAATAGLALRFQREIQTIAQLRHPGIVAVHDTGRAGGFVYFSMDYIEGGDLARRFREHPPTPREAAILLQKIAAALAYAHAAGILHRDLKPSNILLDGEEPQLADFGLAAQLEAGGDLTAQSGVLGTPHYLAPEALLRGSAALTVASDIYALGVIAFELITGRTPYAGASPAELPTLLLNSDPPAPHLLVPAVPRDLETICLKCLERDPLRRYASAAALAEDLRRFLAGEAIAAQPPSAFYSFKKFARRHRIAFAAAATIAVVLVAATVVSSWLAVRATRAEKHAASEAAAARAVSDFLRKDLLGRASPLQEPDRDLKLRAVLDRAAKNIDGRFADQPLVEETLRETLGSTYRSLGEYALEKQNLDRALELTRRLYGPDDARTLDLSADLVMSFLSLGDHAAAERQAREVRARQIQVLGPEHPNTLTTASYLGQVLAVTGQHAAATELLRETLAARTRVLGPDAQDTVGTESVLADVLSAQGKFAEAQTRQKSVLEKQRRVLGPDHPFTIRTLVSMGLTCYSAGQLTDSIRIYREAASLSQRVNGPDAPATLTTMSNLAQSLRANGEWAEAEIVLQPIIPTLRRTRGPEHPSTLAAMDALSSLYRAEQKFAEAEALLRECRAALERAHDSPASLTTNVLLDLSGVLQDQDRLSEAETLAHENFDLCVRTFGREHPTTSNAMGQVASIYHDQARYDEALALNRATTELRRKTLGTDHVSTLTSLYSTGNTLRMMGRSNEAEPLYREALEGRLRRLGPKHPSTLATRDRLAQSLILQGHFAEAETLLRTNLALRQQMTNEAWRAFDTQSLLGEALAGLGRPAEAEPLLLASQEKLHSLAPALSASFRPLARDATARLVRFYTQLGRTDEARRWTETAAQTENTVRP